MFMKFPISLGSTIGLHSSMTTWDIALLCLFMPNWMFSPLSSSLRHLQRTRWSIRSRCWEMTREGSIWAVQCSNSETWHWAPACCLSAPPAKWYHRVCKSYAIKAYYGHVEGIWPYHGVLEWSSASDIPGVQCQKLKRTNIGLAGSMERHNNNNT